MHSTDVQPASLPKGLRDIYLWWQVKAGTRPMPALSDMRLEELNGQSHNLAMSEILRDADRSPSDFRIPFISADLRPDISGQLIGNCFSTLPGKGPGSRIWEGHHTCASLGVPIRACFPYIGPNPAFASTCDVLLPLADEQGQTRFILAGVAFLPVEGQEPHGAD